jgi:hypothetical protein
MPPIRQFRCFTSVEQLEHRRQGLCFNYDNPYVHSHICPWLFYLESMDFVNEELREVDTKDCDISLP